MTGLHRRGGSLAQRVALGLLSLAAAGLQLSYGEPGLLFLGPFLVLFATLMMGFYPGERLLEKLTARPVRVRLRPPRLALQPRSRRYPIPRGSALLAASLAGRAPPFEGAPQGGTERRVVLPRL